MKRIAIAIIAVMLATFGVTAFAAEGPVPHHHHRHHHHHHHHHNVVAPRP